MTTVSVEHGAFGSVDQARFWYHEQSEGVKTLLVVLTIVFACVLFCGIAALSCWLICIGSAFWGVLSFAFGTTGIIMGTIALIRKIRGEGGRRVKHY
jgi:biotin transporter BioY